MFSDFENAGILSRHSTMCFLIWVSFRWYLYKGNFAPLNESQRKNVMAPFSEEQVLYWVEIYFLLQEASLKCLHILAASEAEALSPLAVYFKMPFPAVN